MSIAVPLDELGDALAERPWGYLLTVRDDGRAQTLAVPTVWRDGVLVLANGAQEAEVLSAHRPAVAKLLKDPGKLTPNDILVAACAAWALDTPAELIRAGVKSYGQSPTTF